MFFVLYFKNNLTYTLNELIYGCLWSSLLYLRKKKNAEKETEMNASWFFSVSGKIKKFYSSKKMTRLFTAAWTRSSCGFGDGKKHHYLSREWLFIAINYSNRLLAAGKVERGSRLCYVTSFSFGFVDDVNEKCILCKER